MKALYCLVPLLASLLAVSAAPADQDNRKVEGSTGEIVWGEHWSGPELKASEDLKGKVVLLKIWGG